ncbi:MAG TPA: transglycosylase family protein [Solirubrobacteraceae bacterium]|jgi:septal ring factor EnvC (AmiA/AmiB activator)
MTTIRRTAFRRRAATAAAGFAALAALAALPTGSSADPGLGQLQSQLANQQSRQQHLQSSLGGLTKLVSSLSSQISLVQNRAAAVQSELSTDRLALAAARTALHRERLLLALLKKRLARSRTALARQLVSSYESDQPDLVSVVLESHGFNDLLERLTFLKAAEHQQQGIITITRLAKARTDAAAKRMAVLEANDRRITEDATVRAQALQGMQSLLASKQNALKQAQAVQQAALDASKQRGQNLQASISKIEAQQAAAQAAQAAQAQQAQQQSASSGSASSGPALGPSGGWAIPYSIVLCESGGQNLPPNSAGASGYYQIIPSTWTGFGGTGPAAYLASKAEQDAVASRIWNGGAGASDWVCAGIVGIH